MQVSKAKIDFLESKTEERDLSIFLKDYDPERWLLIGLNG